MRITLRYYSDLFKYHLTIRGYCMKKFRLLFLISLLPLFGFSWPFSMFMAPEPSISLGSNSWVAREFQLIKAHAPNIDNRVLKLSLQAYLNARRLGYASKGLLMVMDYSKPSTEKRLWVFNLKNGKTLFNTWASHGKNSGGVLSTSFSNQRGSLKSSLGVFVTESAYMGGNGYSLRLKGLEKGINDQAYNRAVVIHGAWYVNPDTIRKYGQIGRSWGCIAVGTQLSRVLIDTIKNDTLVFAYYPNQKWLSNSRFLA